jgi:hypothetical protein
MAFKHIPKSVHLLAIIIAISLLPINSEANRGAYMSNEIIYAEGRTLLANNWRQLIVKRVSTVFPVPASRTWREVNGRELSGEFLKLEEEMIVLKASEQNFALPISELAKENHRIARLLSATQEHGERCLSRLWCGTSP